MTKLIASDIITTDANATVLREFFAGLASCEFYDGHSHQLYLDLDDGSLFYHLEASNNSWLQRDDGSLIQVLAVSGYDDTPEDERYNEEDGDDLNDFGFAEWLAEVEERISETLNDHPYLRLACRG